MRSTVAGRAPGTTSGTVVLTWPKPTLDASTAMNAIVVTRCAVLLGTVMLPARDRKDVALLRVRCHDAKSRPIVWIDARILGLRDIPRRRLAVPGCLGPTHLQPNATRNGMQRLKISFISPKLSRGVPRDGAEPLACMMCRESTGPGVAGSSA